MDKLDDTQRTDALIAAQNRTAVATLAAAIVQLRGNSSIPAILDAVRDAEHIIKPNRETDAYREWRKQHGV